MIQSEVIQKARRFYIVCALVMLASLSIVVVAFWHFQVVQASHPHGAEPDFGHKLLLLVAALEYLLGSTLASITWFRVFASHA